MEFRTVKSNTNQLPLQFRFYASEVSKNPFLNALLRGDEEGEFVQIIVIDSILLELPNFAFDCISEVMKQYLIYKMLLDVVTTNYKGLDFGLC